jgi:hypothetical protein
MSRAAALVVCVAALAPGCGGNGGHPLATKVPAGFTVRAVKDQGFSIALPKDWRSLDAHEALSTSQLKQFRQANPQLGSAIRVLASPNSPIKLLAVDPNVKGRFLTNLNVIVTRVPSGISFEKWSKIEFEQIKEVAKVKGLTRKETQLQPGRALHLTYRAGFNRASGSHAAYVHQYFVRNGGFLYVLTYSTRPADERAYRQTFVESARTFRLSG